MQKKLHKLTREQVQDIQMLYLMNVSMRKIAQHFDISVSTVIHHTGHGSMKRYEVPEILEAIAA